MNKEIFISGGCSFTHGSELLTKSQNWSMHLYKACRLYKKRWFDIKNTALPGSGNGGIARRVFNEVLQHKPEDINPSVNFKPLFESWCLSKFSPNVHSNQLVGSTIGPRRPTAKIRT